MDAEEVLKLFDSTWFERVIFNKESISPTSDRFEVNQQSQIKVERSVTNICPVKHLRIKPMSKSLSFKSSILSDSLSPDSVLFREITETKDPSQKKKETSKVKKAKCGRRKWLHESKSLSDLEFKEIKGFMDLGFVFSEEDKDSSIASIIPGLQTMGKKEEDVGSGISRPYLSESWKILRRRNIKKPLMKWMLPALTNEIDMKDNLRWWAQTVASTVR